MYLAVTEMFEAARSGASIDACMPRWLGGKKCLQFNVKAKLNAVMQTRTNGMLSFVWCPTTHMWVRKLSLETLQDALKPIQSWLTPGWANKIEKKKRKITRSIALF